MGRFRDFWTRILHVGDKEVEVAKSGDNYYANIKIGEETIMTIVQPPTSYDGKTGVGGEISLFDSSGKLQADRSKAMKYGEPIILFNSNNKAGLKLLNAISETKTLLPQALQNAPDVKINVDKVDEDHTISVQTENRVAIGSSAVLQIDKDASVSVINSPKVDEADRETLESFLQFAVIALEGKQQTYRANIMLLDPRDNLLKITAQYNMEGKVDRNISLSSTAGCAGDALQNNQEAFFDIRGSTHSKLHVNPDKVWKELKSIISMPIRASNGNRLGVLNIDSDNTIDQTKFYDVEFKNAMGLVSDAFGSFLEKKV
jgi:hypothetical protein